MSQRPTPGTCGASGYPLPLRRQELTQLSGVRTEPLPSRAKQPHAVLAVLTTPLCGDIAHRHHGIDGPSPEHRPGTAVLDADASDLEIEAFVLEDDPVVVDGLGVDDATEVEVHHNTLCMPPSQSHRTKSEISA